MGNKLNQKKYNAQNDTSVLPDDRINWRYQDKTFNELFKQWRKNNKGNLGFYYANNPKELTYQDRVGFIKDYPESAETSAVQNVYNLIGRSLLFFSVIDILYMYIVPAVMNGMGFNISLDFYNNQLYGNEWILSVMFIIWSFLRRIGPFLINFKRLKMPATVMLPTKISNKPMFKHAVPMMLLVCAVGYVCSEFFNMILSTLHVSTAPTLYLPDTTGPIILALVAQIIIIPILSEVVARGVFLQLLRQFGDGSAIIFTSFITAALTYNLKSFCYLFLISVIIGYFTIQTGSIYTAIVMRITASVFACSLGLLKQYVPIEYSNFAMILFFFVVLCIGFVFTIRFMIKYSDNMGMTMKNRYLTFSQKLMAGATCIPIVLWLTATFIITLLKTNFIF